MQKKYIRHFPGEKYKLTEFVFRWFPIIDLNISIYNQQLVPICYRLQVNRPSTTYAPLQPILLGLLAWALKVARFMYWPRQLKCDTKPATEYLKLAWKKGKKELKKNV